MLSRLRRKTQVAFPNSHTLLYTLINAVLAVFPINIQARKLASIAWKQKQRSQEQQAAEAAGSGEAGDSGWQWDSAPGEKTLESMAVYKRDAATAAAMHDAGLARISQLVRDTKLPRKWQQEVMAATQSASWDMDVRIKVRAWWC